MDTADTLRIVQNKSNESEAYRKQLHNWLGVSSAGGAIAMVSFAASLPDPAYVLNFLLPSLWSFLVGVIAAGASVLFSSLRAEAMGAHYAQSHNRSQANEAIKSTPEVFSSPQRIAADANRERNALIEVSRKEHQRAEESWALKQRYSLMWCICLAASALAFTVGFAWPLVNISFFGANLVPG